MKLSKVVIIDYIIALQKVEISIKICFTGKGYLVLKSPCSMWLHRDHFNV